MLSLRSSVPLTVLSGVLLVVASCAAVQGSAALASTLFDVVSPAGVVAWRQLFGAATLLIIAAIARRLGAAGALLRRRPRGEWGLILALGAAMAAMNLSYYVAVRVLPLGVAATMMFLGPFALAALASRRGRQLIGPLLALLGVVLISRPGGAVDVAGLLLGALAAVALAVYTICSGRLGDRGGVDSLALASVVSALLLSPLAASHAAEPTPAAWAVLVALGVVGISATFLCDFLALRLLGARAVATLFALDPVIGAIIGVIFLADALSPGVGAGILAVAAGGALTMLTAASRSRAPRPETDRGAGAEEAEPNEGVSGSGR